MVDLSLLVKVKQNNLFIEIILTAVIFPWKKKVAVSDDALVTDVPNWEHERENTLLSAELKTARKKLVSYPVVIYFRFA